MPSHKSLDLRNCLIARESGNTLWRIHDWEQEYLTESLAPGNNPIVKIANSIRLNRN
jgi:hypothetical protein